MGATAVPGALTKGDLDLLVRVSAEEFVPAVETLQAQYEIHQPENWTETYASFKEVAAEMPVGLQLVVAGSDLDRAFVELRALLRKSPDLLERLNELKRSFEGGDPDAYVEAKGALIEDLLQRPPR